ncbi:MAG TPA: alpha/beta hydrolase [Phycisphaerales bacterium]|nr:alpha/beta hydrolase [Phycisphaerales bacterium]
MNSQKPLATAILLSSICIVSALRADEPQKAANPAEARHAEVAFTPIPHVEKRGTGPINMVLIPGLSCDWTVFKTFMERNADRYTMYTVTLPGFGGSEAPPAEADGQFGAWLDNAATAVWKIVADSKIEKPVIMGHSLGGHLALRIGEEHAKDIRAVVAIDGAPAFPYGDTDVDMTKEQREEMATNFGAQFKMQTPEQMAAGQKLMVQSMVTNQERGLELAEMCVKVPAATTIQYMLDLISADIREDLPKLTVPTLVTPSADSTDSAEIQQVKDLWVKQLKGAPNVTIAMFENTKHFIQDDRPAELDAAISNFLAGKPVSGYSLPAESSPASSPAE